MPQQIVLAQIIIVAAYLLLTVLIGAVSARRVKSSSTFAGSNLGLLMCVVCGAGEWLGGTSTTGVAEYGYACGISGAWYTIANGIGVILFAALFAGVFRRLGKITVSSIIGNRLGERAKTVSSISSILAMAIVGASQMAAIGTLGQALLGLSPAMSIIALGIPVIAYTCFGGMLAVGYTNILHLVTMYAGGLIALAVSLARAGGPAAIASSLPPSYFDFSSIGYGKIAAWLIASVLGASISQAAIQPVLAAKDERTAKRASFCIGALVAPFGIFTALLGMIAKAQFPNLQNAKLALPQLMASLPPPAGGMVLAAMLAAILSTASPIFLACATLFSKDIYPRIAKSASETRALKASKLATILSGLICMALAIFLYDSAALLDIVYFAYSIRGSLFIVLLLGLFCKRATQAGAVAGMLAALSLSIAWIAIKSWTGSYPIHPEFSETYIAVLAALAFTLIFSNIDGRKN